MSGIVERLRRLVILDEVGSDNPLGREAAGEIERLREALKKAEIALCAAEIVIDADDCVETFNLIQGTRQLVQAALSPAKGERTSCSTKV